MMRLEESGDYLMLRCAKMKIQFFFSVLIFIFFLISEDFFSLLLL